MGGRGVVMYVACVVCVLCPSVIIARHLRVCMGEFLPDVIMSVGGWMNVALLTMSAHLFPKSGCGHMSVMCCEVVHPG